MNSSAINDASEQVLLKGIEVIEQLNFRFNMIVNIVKPREGISAVAMRMNDDGITTSYRLSIGLGTGFAIGAQHTFKKIGKPKEAKNVQ
ncbi:MAG: hypothetical protein ACK5XN_37100 [Bacteroidota bacterium]